LEEIERDSTKLNLQPFFETKINALDITSTKWLFDYRGEIGVIYKSDIQKGKILDKKGNLIFKTKGFDKKSLEISKDEIQTLFQDKNLKVELTDLSKHLKFTTNCKLPLNRTA
jgi:hypothetical protein